MTSARRVSHIKPKTTSGFTLVEIVIATAIIVLLIGSVGVMMRLIIRTNAESRVVSSVSSVVQNKVESLRNTKFSSLTVGQTTFTNELPDNLPRPRSATLDISDKTANLKEIKIEVHYGDRSEVYKTYVSKSNTN